MLMKAEALRFYEKAANSYEPIIIARKAVVRFYREGKHVEKSEEKAIELEEKWGLR